MYGFKFLISRLRCDQMRRFSTRIMCPNNRKIQLRQIRSYVSRRVVNRPIEAFANDVGADDDSNWPRKIFSGIQPTGALHLGNYLGAVRKWTQLQEANEDVTYCIVDMHSITLPQDPAVLRENIFKLAATMLACGINPNHSTVFVQSAVKEHSELCWLIGTLCTMARLGHLPQYKDKTRQLKDIPLGLFVYPILQAADILLYKSTHVPVGEDQIQHIQLTQHLAKIFNSRFGQTFPVCHAMIEDKQVSRIRSLRDPSKKMSKSDPDPKSAIFITDEPDVVLEKVKKALTDFCSDVSYDPEGRPGVSNLIAIHSHMSGQPIEDIISEARSLDTGKYKLRVAEAINEHLKPIREKIQGHLENRNELMNLLENGAEKARNIAFDTVEEVKHRMGLGAPYLPLYLDTLKPVAGSMEIGHKQSVTQAAMTLGTLTTIQAQTTTTTTIKQAKPILEPKLATLEVSRKLSAVQKPAVPQQRLRIEKILRQRRTSTATDKPVNIVSDITSDLLQKDILQKSASKNEHEKITSAVMRELPKIRRIARCVEVKPPQTNVPSVVSQQQSTATTKYEGSSQTNRVVENMLLANPQKSNTLSLPSPSPSSSPSQSPSPSPTPSHSPSSSSALAISKTTLPAAWSGAKTKSSNGEHSTHNNTTETTFKTTNQTTSKTFKRNITTTTSQLSMKDSCKNDKSHMKQQSIFNRKIVGRTLFYGVLVIGAGFGGVYYFWRSILKAYFDIKKNGGS